MSRQEGYLAFMANFGKVPDSYPHQGSIKLLLIKGVRSKAAVKKPMHLASILL
jgi:hypothetical protein